MGMTNGRTLYEQGRSKKRGRATGLNQPIGDTIMRWQKARPGGLTMTAAEFRAARLTLGMTQKALGEIMGMLQPAIAEIESGRRSPTKIQAAFIRLLLK